MSLINKAEDAAKKVAGMATADIQAAEDKAKSLEKNPWIMWGALGAVVLLLAVIFFLV